MKRWIIDKNQYESNQHSAFSDQLFPQGRLRRRRQMLLRNLKLNAER
jgi:hypothetical protein